MEMQCLHAWEKSINCHFENVLTASQGFYLVLPSALSSLFSFFFPPCAHPEEKQMV